MYQDSDDDSGGEHKRDLFEEALEQIRSNIVHEIDYSKNDNFLHLLFANFAKKEKI